MAVRPAATSGPALLGTQDPEKLQLRSTNWDNLKKRNLKKPE
jgi:hypothetical protein